MKISNRPNFFIVGAQKAGTTALWHFLRQHPQVFMPDKIKEPCFFRGDPSDFDVDLHISLAATPEAEAYLALFSKVRDEVAIGGGVYGLPLLCGKKVREILFKQFLKHELLLFCVIQLKERIQWLLFLRKEEKLC